ncbi:MAG: hypothetical protein IT347_08200 [Candidatus Eisenbacteria bacterium]|nr:hypothetical protein [Candidatus Eisenbacteria bacterium]
MPIWVIVAFVVFDVALALFVLRTVLARRGGLKAVLGTDLRNIMEVSSEMERETENYLRANWSGDPTTLPVALGSLLDRFEARVRDRQLPVTRAELKPMLGRLVLAQRLASGHDVQEALKRVA